MGFNDFMEKRAQRLMLQRAMEAYWVAYTSDLVFGPLVTMLGIAVETGKAQRHDVDDFLDNWLQTWQPVRHLSDRNLNRNRDYYIVRPNEVLSPILSDFQKGLESIRASSQLGPSEAVAEMKAAILDNRKKLIGSIRSSFAMYNSR